MPDSTPPPASSRIPGQGPIVVDSRAWTGLTDEPAPPRPEPGPPIPMAPEVRYGRDMLWGCFALLVGYTVMICNLDPAMAAAIAGWTTPVTRVMAYLAPAVRMVETGLQQRGFPERAAIVAHVYAVQWLLAYAGLLSSLPYFWRGRYNLKARAQRARRLPGSRYPDLRLYIAVAGSFVFCLVLPLFGPSQAQGGFDLALSNAHLYVRFALVGVWLATDAAVAVFVIRILARTAAPFRPESPAR